MQTHAPALPTVFGLTKRRSGDKMEPPSDASEKRPDDDREEIAVAIGIVRRGDEFLVGIRDAEAPLPGLAEFPGGKCLAGEAPEQCVIREVREETGLDVVAVGLRQEVRHEYEHARLRLSFFDCQALLPDQEPRPPFHWTPRGKLAQLRFPEANAGLITALVDSRDEEFPQRSPGARGE